MDSLWGRLLPCSSYSHFRLRSSIQDINPTLLDDILAPAFHVLNNYIRGVRRTGAIDDVRFVRLGVCRVLSGSGCWTTDGRTPENWRWATAW